MTRLPFFVPLLAVACSGPTTVPNETTVVEDAAETSALATPDSGATPSPKLVPAPVAGSTPVRPNPSGGEPAVPEPGAPIPATDLPEGPFTPESAQGAANVVQTYFALIGEGQYRRAYRLWGGGGRASGMTADAFVASFDKYRTYLANVGGPGPIDAGAGQRYVTVPVRVTGTLKAGDRPFVLDGPMTLHRTADIDGATPAQKSWRISASGLKPHPDLADQRAR